MQRVVVGLAFVAVAMASWLTAYAPRAESAASDELLVWGAVVLGLGVTAALVFDLGRRQLDGLPIDRDGHRATIRRAWHRAVVAATVGTALVAVGSFGIERSASMARGFVLTTLAIVAAVPAAATLFAVALVLAAVGSDPGGRKEGAAGRLVLLRRLRMTGRSSVTAMGSLVALTTFALGAARLVPPEAGEEQLSAATVLVFGGTGTALLAAVYSVAHRPLREHARDLADELAPLQAADPADLRDELEQREKLEHQLGLDLGLVDELRIGVFVYGPLLSAAVSLLLTGR